MGEESWEAPKKPMSPYMLFANDITKNRYQRKHKRLMLAYEEEVPKEDRKKVKKVRDPNAPKRPMGAFFLWFQKNRAKFKKENPSNRLADVGKIAGAKWRKMSDKDKKPWVAKAAEAKKTYQKQMEKYNA